MDATESISDALDAACSLARDALAIAESLAQQYDRHMDAGESGVISEIRRIEKRVEELESRNL